MLRAEEVTDHESITVYSIMNRMNDTRIPSAGKVASALALNFETQKSHASRNSFYCIRSPIIP